jgi:hypothetical protein
VLQRLRQSWRRLRRAKPGRRFRDYHERAQRRPNGAVTRVVRLVGALVALAIAIVLTVLPGPAVVFYFLAGMLIAADSALAARWLDRTEAGLRGLWRRWRRRGADGRDAT